MLNGRATNLPKPAYPPAAKSAGAKGQVVVQVVVDENGNVISANAISGDPLLRESAEQAARIAKFSGLRPSGNAVKMTGTLIYNFAP